MKALGVVLFCCMILGAGPTPPASPPNVVIFFADDLGYADVGYHGILPEVETPNIDRIASQGVYFTQGYVTCSICAPSRASLLTGRYQQRWGYDDCPGPIRRDPDVRPGIPPEQLQLAEYLKPRGYATAFIGKHHDGQSRFCNPYFRGFDYFHGYLNTGHGYFLEDNFTPDRKEKTDGLFWENDKPLFSPPKGYITDRYAEMASDWIDKNRENPFFLYLPFSAVHGHVEARPEHVKKFLTPALRERWGGPDVPGADQRVAKRADLLGCLYAMDEAVGAVLDTLEKHGLADNTLVLFASDNGGKPAFWKEQNGRWDGNDSQNLPLRGGKYTMFEGGHRIPFCMRWPGRIDPGSVYRHPVCTIDVVPTVLSALGIEPPANNQPFDGVDLLPHLDGTEKERPHESLFWRLTPGWAVRHGDFKLMQSLKGGKPMLFDLAGDVSESRDLAGEMPEKVKRLREIYDGWNAGMLPAMWGRNPNGIHGDYRVSPHSSNYTIFEEERENVTIKRFRGGK